MRPEQSTLEKEESRIELIKKTIVKMQGKIEPIDPAAGLVQCQGHHTLHLAYFIVLMFFVRPIEVTYIDDRGVE